MASPTDLRKLKADEWEQLQEWADRFEEAWKTAAPADLAAFLPPPEHSLRAVALQELITTELEVRWRRGQGMTMEQYVERFPELGGAGSLPAKLLYEEYRVRQLFGDRPELASFQARFPAQFAELERLVQEQPLPTIGIANPTPNQTQKPAPGPASNRAVTGETKMLTVGSDYRQIKRIGSGGFGEVWLGEAPGGVEVAIKIIFRPLDSEESKREQQSLELIKRLRHPFLLQTQSYWSLEDRLYIVMELADGSLRDRLKECRQTGLTGIPATELVRYFRESAEALDYLHSEHVLHRDIKPDNILVLKRHAKLADFGLARLQESQRSAAVSGSGTPAYMAPEIWRGKASERSDQYSLALAYAELRLDRRMIAGREMMELMIEHLERMPNLEGLPENEQQVLLKALSKDPAQRFPTCLEFALALEQVVPAGAHIMPTAAGTAVAAQSARLSIMAKTQEPSRPAQPALSATSVTAAAPSTGNWRDTKKPGSLLPRLAVVFVALGLAAALGLGIYFWPRGQDSTAVSSLSPTPTDTPQPAIVNEKKPHLPAGCEPGINAAVVRDGSGKDNYSRVDRVLPSGKRVPFVLLLRQEPDDPPTFYMMEHKTSNEVFAEFATSDPGAVRDGEWRLGGRADAVDVGNTNPHLPVLRVTVEQAQRCARWLGGSLPTTKQWDKAAGFYRKPRSGQPFKGPLVAINRRKEGPRDVFFPASEDISPLDIRDLCGNGREWTRNLTDQRTVPIDHPGKEDLVILRGRSYTATRPLTYADLEEEQKVQQTQTQFYLKASPYTGFRVVIELDDEPRK